MAGTILDGELKRWEAFASTGRYGFADRAQVVFQCTSDPWERPRAYTMDGDKAAAEQLVARGTSAELAALFASARPVS